MEEVQQKGVQKEEIFQKKNLVVVVFGGRTTG